MITISISNRKGGSAKSTTAINLAAELAKTKSVLLIDMDTQGHATLGVGGVSSEDAGVHTIFSGALLSQTLMPTKMGNLTLSPASKLFCLDDDLHSFKVLADAIKNEGLEDFFDYCVIDTAPTYDIFLKNALFASNCVVIPVVTQPLGIDGAFQMFRAILKSKIELGSKIDFVGVLPVMYNPHIKEHTVSLQELKSTIGEERIFEPIGVDIGLSRQFEEREPLVLCEKRSRGAVEYRRFVKTLLERIGCE